MCRALMRFGADQMRPQQIAHEGHQVGDGRRRAVSGGIGPAGQRGAAHTERFEHRLAQIRAELDGGTGLDHMRKNGKAVVGVDPPRSRFCHHGAGKQ